MEQLEPEKYYHIYNRANGNDLIFISAGNHDFFLDKYNQYISPVADTFCYCLMPNHFHFLIRVKSEKDLIAAFPNAELQGLKNSTPNPELQGFKNLAALLSHQFSIFFNSYAKAFNKQQNRKGSLFMKNFKRKHITDEGYLLKLVHYIHFNPVKSGLCKLPSEWKYSSYHILLDEKPGFLKKEVVMEWFEDKENFMYTHQYAPELTGIS